MSANDKDLYSGISSAYDSIAKLPTAIIERQYIEYALKDCAGKTMIDLGGGTGLHAREAVDLGVKLVDLVDVSNGMLEDGKAASAGRNDPIRWHLGDISGPLDDLPLEKAYDITLVGWTFDHAQNLEQLEGMWKNTALFTKPGGKLINTRVKNVNSESAQSGKYGVKLTDVKEIPGGLQYQYHMLLNPPWSCPASSMNANLDFEQSKKIAERHGFTDFKTVPMEEMQVVKDDPEFWQQYLNDPMFVCITATKSG